MITIGAQIRAARGLLDWTRSQLAQASGLHKNAIAYWERHADIPTDPFRVSVAVRQIDEAFQREGVRLFVSRDFSAGVGLVRKKQFPHQYVRVRVRGP